MYKEEIPTKTMTQPEYLSIADQFSEEMINRFNAIELNNLLNRIRLIFKERRETEIQDTKNRLEYLEESLKDL